MKNFIFKSSDPDLQKMFQYLETIQKNVLYMTHRMDLAIRKINTLEVDKHLQKQTLDFYEEEPVHPEDKMDLD